MICHVTHKRMSLLGFASVRSHRGINNTAAMAIIDHESPCGSDVVTASAVVRDVTSVLERTLLGLPN